VLKTVLPLRRDAKEEGRLEENSKEEKLFAITASETRKKSLHPPGG